MTVSNGGAAEAMSLSVASGNGSQGTVNVTTGGSLTAQFADFGRGSGQATLNVSSGGTAAFTSALYLGYDGNSAGTANVTEAGSTLSVGAGGLLVGTGVSSRGFLNVSNGGTVRADGGSGTISLGSGPDASGFLTIGSDTGSAVAPGQVDAAEVSLSSTSRITFNHTSGSYVFAPQITGAGGIELASGTTILTGANTYTGGTTISGGTVEMRDDSALGTGTITLGTATLRLAGISTLNSYVIPAGTTATITSAAGTTSYINGTGGLSFSLQGNLVFGSATDSGTVVFEPLVLPISSSSDVLVAGGQVVDGNGALSWLTHVAAATRVAAGTVLDLGIYGGDIRNLQDGPAGAGTVTWTSNPLRVQAGNFSGRLTGTGGLAKTGTGTLTLSGNNDYTGGTTIDGGTLAVSADANLGAASGGLTFIAGTLRFNRSFDLDPGRTIKVVIGSGTFDTNGFNTTIRQDVTGGGALVKTGAGTLTLEGTNRLSETVVAQGTLKGSAASFGTGKITNNATLVFDQTVAGTYAAEIGGSGTLTKIGAGLLNLTGNSSLSGPTHVQAGRLAVNGSLASSAVSVDTGATLSGTGTIGGLAALAGSTVAPGNSIGTLNVAGAVSFAPGSTFAVEIDAAGNADRIAATGPATLSGGKVQVLPDQGTGYIAGSPYTILTASNVSGKFTGTNENDFAYVIPVLDHSDTAVTVTLVRRTAPPQPPSPEPPAPVPPSQPLRFHAVAETRNQYDTADAVEALGAGARLYDILLGASVGGARQAFDALSGEVHASTAAVAYEDGRLVREGILNRLRQPSGPAMPSFVQADYKAAYAADGPQVPQPVALAPAFDPRRFALWGEGFGSWGRTRSNGNAASLDASTGGFILGADAGVTDGLRIGLAGGFMRTAFDVDSRLSSGTNESVFGALYGSAAFGNLTARLGTSYAWHDIDTQRHVQFPGFADAASASYNGSTIQGFGEIGYRLDLGRARIEPFVGASVMRLRTDRFQEEGGVAALTGYGRDQDLATSTLGVRGEIQVARDTPLLLKGMLGWRRAYGDVEPEALLAFADGASAFAISGVPVDRDALVVEAGMNWQASRDISLAVAYQGQVGSRAQEHALKGSFLWRFSTR